MGALKLPESGVVYIDTQILVYTVESHPKYAPALIPLWSASRQGAIQITTSELALLEVMVRPLRDSDHQLERDYREFLLNSDIHLKRIEQSILLDAAGLRAAIPSLRTPDAIHAATARSAGSAMLLTNDSGLKQVPGLNVVLLDEVVSG